MRLEAKLALFNALSKLLLVLLGVVVIPPIVSRVAILHTDFRLEEKREQVLGQIQQQGLFALIRNEQNEAFSDFNILKQEYITISPWRPGRPLAGPRFSTERRQVDQQVEDYRILNSTFRGPDLRVYQLEIGSSLATVELLTDTLRQMALWVLVVGALLTIITDALFAHYLLRPLRQLIRRKLEGVRHPATFPFETIATDTTDFRNLDDSLNTMMRTIQSAFEKEQEFMSNVSHELLTPVSILQSRFENMLQDPTLGEEHSLKIVESQKTLYRLRNTVKTLLLIANIENAKFLRDEAVPLRPLVQDVLDELEDRIAQREIQVSVDLQPDYTVEQANRTLLFTLLFNLVSNAVKYNHAGGHILLQGRPAGAGYLLRVQDSGPGIAPENLPFLFDRFRRFAGGTPSQEGYGLGLPIARTIAAFHGATLNVESTPGAGTSFLLQFPG